MQTRLPASHVFTPTTTASRARSCATFKCPASLRWGLAALTAASTLAFGTALAQNTTLPERVVTLAPHITEMVYAAGASQNLVGTVISSDYPLEARGLPKVGDGAASINAEALISLKPSLVLAWQDTGAVAAVAPLLQDLGIPLMFIAPQQIAEIPDLIEKLGTRLGTLQQAKHTADSQRDALARLSSRYSRLPPVPVYIEIGHTPLYAVGHDPLLNDALHVCGGVNVFQDSRLLALPIGPEQVLQKRPGVILIANTNPLQEQEAKIRWSKLGLTPATGTHIYNIDPDTLFRPGPRLIEATAKICHALQQTRMMSGQ